MSKYIYNFNNNIAHANFFICDFTFWSVLRLVNLFTYMFIIYIHFVKTCTGQVHLSIMNINLILNV